MIVPSGQRRQMENQSYLWNDHDGQIDGIIEKMLQKAAALDIAPSEAAGELGPPQVQRGGQPNEMPGQTNDVANAMDQSTTLPQQDQEAIMVVNKDGQPRQDQQGQVTKQILEMLLKSKLADPGTYVLTAFDLSNGIQLNATRQATNAGPAIQKP